MSRDASGLHITEHVPTGATDHGTDPGTPDEVLVHGSLDRGSSFARVVRRLPDLHIVTYDRRGYHRSRDAAIIGGDPGAPAGSFDRHVSDLVELIGGRPSVVIGHSLGGDVALAAALEDPEAIWAVGAYEPPLPWVEWWPRRHRQDLTGEDPASFAESFFRRVVSDEAWERLSRAVREERRADGAALVSEMADLRSGKVPFDASALSVPVVLGRGELSIPHHRRSVDALQELIAESEVYEIAGASHGAHLTHPDAFAQMVRSVLARGRSRSPDSA